MKSVLLLGSGLCSRPIIAYLDEHGYKVVVGSRSKGDVKVAGLKNATWIKLDIETEEGEKTLDEWCPKVDVVVSLLPYVFHPKAATFALKHNRHFLTASYVSDGMRALAGDFKNKGLVQISECGVDPGTDHASMSAVVERVHNAGGKILYFTSFAGGLPAPECNDNPFGYKFSWAPKGVLLAGKNSASFYKDGKEMFIPGEELFKSFWHFNVEGFDTFEVYPNRDSKPYRELYRIPEALTCIRGTLRNKGWCEKIKKLVDLGYIDESPHNVSGLSYRELTRQLSKAPEGANLAEHVASFLKIPVDSHVIKAFQWLGLFDDAEKIPENTNQNLDALCYLMRKKMTLAPHERDLLVLRHTFIADYPDKQEHITSTLVDYGFANGDTSMARTTSLPLAIATRMVLDGRFTKPGLTIPTDPDLYVAMMAELATLGIAYTENVVVKPKRHLWLRDEVKVGERRAAITPTIARRLLEDGFIITVEKSAQRCFPIEDYAGCHIVESGAWRNAPNDAFIVGLKELPQDDSALKHRHIFFCHAFKNQAGWKEQLNRFTRGGGSLFDMEYLTFADGRRVAAFGRPAGLAGAAAAVLAWTAQKDGKVLSALHPWKTQLHMIADLKQALGTRRPRAIVLGALGRSGRGAVDVLDAVGCEVTRWDLPETKRGGPFPELLDFDILVNCILLVDKIPPFLTREMVSDKSKSLSVIVDVSCDTSNPNNPLPFIAEGTTLQHPVLIVQQHLHCVAIDHLPTLLPVESSEQFSADLAPHFNTLPEGDVWQRAHKLFLEKSK